MLRLFRNVEIEELDGFTGGFISLLLVPLDAGWSGIRAELCLDDGVPEAQRQYIQDNAGISCVLRVFQFSDVFRNSRLLKLSTNLKV